MKTCVESDTNQPVQSQQKHVGNIGLMKKTKHRSVKGRQRHCPSAHFVLANFKNRFSCNETHI